MGKQCLDLEAGLELYMIAELVEFSDEGDDEVYTMKRLKQKLQEHYGVCFLQKFRGVKMLCALETWLST